MADQKMTDYFHPSLGASFVLGMGIPEAELAIKSLGRRSDEAQEAEQETVGIADCAKANRLYKEILTEALANSESLQEKYEEVIKEWRGPPKSMPRREPKTFPVPNEETEVIFLRFYAGRSVPEIADKLQVAEIKVKDFGKNFSRNLKIRRKSNQKYLNKKKRLDRRHHAFIEEYLNKNLLSVFTLQDLRSVLISEFPELSNLSKPTIGKSLRTQHEMSYRKLSRAVPKTLTEDSHRKMMETAAIMSHLEHQMIEVIFIDEFTVSGRSYKPYGWSKISQKGGKKIGDSNFSMGFIIGFSGRCMYGTMGIKGTTTSTIFAFYLSKLIDHIESSRSSEYQRYALGCDNASYHKTEQVHNLLK